MKLGKTTGKASAACAAALLALASMPATALAEDYKTTINTIVSTATDLFNTIGYALVLLVGGLAFIAASKEMLPALFKRERREFAPHVYACVAIVIVCVLTAFLPAIINAVTTMAGTGVDLGTVSQG